MGAKAPLPLHSKGAHLNRHRRRLGLTGNSTKGTRPSSSDRNHLFEAAQAIITVCNQQGPAGRRGLRRVRSPRHTGPTRCSPICATAGRTRPLATEFPPQLDLKQTPPSLRPALAQEGAPERGGAGRTGLRARARAGERAYISLARREALAWARALSRRSVGRCGRHRRGGAGRGRKGGVAAVHHRGSPGCLPRLKADRVCGSRSCRCGLGGLRR